MTYDTLAGEHDFNILLKVDLAIGTPVVPTGWRLQDEPHIQGFEPQNLRVHHRSLPLLH